MRDRRIVADINRPPRLGFLVDLYLGIGEPAYGSLRRA
jgi:hypothetical protein